MTSATVLVGVFTVLCAAMCLAGLVAARCGHREVSTPLFLLAAVLGAAAALTGAAS